MRATDPTMPDPAGPAHPLAGAAGFLFEMGQLKQQRRSGWHLLGITVPESVADHSARTAMTGVILAAIDGADVGRTALLCLFHDAHETRIGDVQSVWRHYLTNAAPEAVTAHQVAGLPAEAAEVIQGIVAEFETNQTDEAQLAHDADKLEMLAQAREYHAMGIDTRRWIESAVKALRTKTGGQLAQAILLGDPQWWAALNA